MTNNYIDFTYSNEKKPFTSYPGKLIKYLVNRFKIQRGAKILDVCCGRGEFINEFINMGAEGYGLDMYDNAKKYFPKISLKLADLSIDQFPYSDNSFDVVFSKSVVEHFSNSEKIIKESRRVLKPNGLIITMTPSWKHNLVGFYDDFTHKQPFNKFSLENLHKIYDFKDVKVEYFTQLPILWKKNFISRFMSILSYICRVCLPDFVKNKSKFVKFSKEIMLLCYARK